ncbi:MAG TPA: PAS domain S-box protein, partial [Spirochaetota bacterium]|nr:PAS domain S-box protein [Spirochaetota bacterium]
LNIKYCTIFLLDDYEKNYKRYASKSVDEDLIATLPEVKEALFNLAGKNNKSIYINKDSLDEKEEFGFFRSFLKEIEFDSAFTVKMFDKGAFKGCINVINKDEIPEDTRDVLELISHRLCMSIQNSTLFEELTESENKFRNLADSLPQTIIETDFSHKIIYANSNMFETFGYSREDVEKGLYVSQLLEDKYCEKYFKAVEIMMKENKKTGLEYSVKRRNETLFPAIIYAGILYKKGYPSGILAVIADISSQKIAEEESLKLEKLESLGILAGGIAHDFNNILTAILGNVTLAKIYSDPEDKIFEILKEAERACIRSKDLTQQLLTFSKGGLPVKKVASIKSLIEESVIFILRGSNIKPEFKFGENIDKVEMDEGQINQVINNLIINSVQAMPEGGAITVGCENISFDINNP